MEELTPQVSRHIHQLAFSPVHYIEDSRAFAVAELHLSG
jgi:hypothetical protein